MPQVLSPDAAHALMQQGGVDIIDVRDVRDWAAGHVPGARSVPLEELRAATAAHLKQDHVLFVCARGVRSLTAAGLAEAIGLTQVASLEGGMLAWAQAALPMTVAPRSASPPANSSERNVVSESVPPPLPEPELDAVVGQNLHALRAARGLSLDTLARLTGLSRTLLGQIEIGNTSPSVSIVWKLARAFDVPFSVLLATAQPNTTTVLRKSQAKRIEGGDGRFSSRALFPPGTDTSAEFYEVVVAPYSREDAQAHQPGTRESLVVAAGRLELQVGTESFSLSKGDAIVFHADVAHSYNNPDKEELWFYLVMTYGGRSGDGHVPWGG